MASIAPESLPLYLRGAIDRIGLDQSLEIDGEGLIAGKASMHHLPIHWVAKSPPQGNFIRCPLGQQHSLLHAAAVRLFSMPSPSASASGRTFLLIAMVD